MHKLIAPAFVMVSGCATVSPPASTAAGAAAAVAPTTSDNIPVHGATPGRVCNASAGQAFVGQPANSDSQAAILRATNAAVLRWVRPGMMLTMEFREDRATVRVGTDNRITQVGCS